MAAEDHQAIAPIATTDTEASTALIPSDAQPQAEGMPQVTALKTAGKEPRAGTKQTLVIKMLNRPNGAGITELIIATD